MNDHHLDPPEYPEPPEWYSSIDAILDEENPPEQVATSIRKTLDDWAQSCNEEYDQEPEPSVELPEDFHDGPEHCPHGKEWGDCSTCDHLADLAFHAARESGKR